MSWTQYSNIETVSTRAALTPQKSGSKSGSVILQLQLSKKPPITWNCAEGNLCYSAAMEDKTALIKVQESLESVQAELSVAKARVLELENQERRLTVTLEVLQSLGAAIQDVREQHPTLESGRVASVLSDEVPSVGRNVWSVLSVMLRKTTRQLILEQFMAGEALTRIQVIDRIKATGEQPNEQTVASTLSKLTADGVLERDGNAYRLKATAPSADDTGSGHDLV